MTRPYLSPEEAAQADAFSTLQELQRVIARCELLLVEKAQLHTDLEDADEDQTEAVEWRLKQLKSEETSLHRIGSMLQSVLRVP
jgi:chaperonin cofactor prefoldin